MTDYEFGEIVLVDFPQTGPAETKRRPALVILDIGDDDVVLAPVTSRERSGAGDQRIEGWRDCGLLRESWVRLAKVACLRKTDIARRLGLLTPGDRDAIAEAWQRLVAPHPCLPSTSP